MLILVYVRLSLGFLVLIIVYKLQNVYMVYYKKGIVIMKYIIVDIKQKCICMIESFCLNLGVRIV